MKHLRLTIIAFSFFIAHNNTIASDVEERTEEDQRNLFADVVKSVFFIACDNANGHENFSVEQCIHNFKDNYFCRNGLCEKKSALWLSELSSTELNDDYDIKRMQTSRRSRYETEKGFRDCVHYHYFNLVRSRKNPDAVVIVDATYLQFFKPCESLSPIFIGTHTELEDLCDKYPLRLNVIPSRLKKSEIKKFVSNNWPIGTENCVMHHGPSQVAKWIEYWKKLDLSSVIEVQKVNAINPEDLF